MTDLFYVQYQNDSETIIVPNGFEILGDAINYANDLWDDNTIPFVFDEYNDIIWKSPNYKTDEELL